MFEVYTKVQLLEMIQKQNLQQMHKDQGPSMLSTKYYLMREFKITHKFVLVTIWFIYCKFPEILYKVINSRYAIFLIILYNKCLKSFVFCTHCILFLH